MHKNIKITKRQQDEIKRIAKLKGVCHKNIILALLRLANESNESVYINEPLKLIHPDLHRDELFEFETLTQNLQPIHEMIEIGLRLWDDEYHIKSEYINYLMKKKQKIRYLIEVEGLRKKEAWRKLKLYCHYSYFIKFCKKYNIGNVAR